MKILMLCPLISSSSFVTTYPMATALSKKHEVTLVGPLFGKKPFINDDSLHFEFIEPLIKHPIQLGFMSLVRRNKKRLLEGDWDVVHAFKLLPHTGPVAAQAAETLGKKFVLSLDDYDAAATTHPLKKWMLSRAAQAYTKADQITVCSTQLQHIYGGTVVYQVPNESLFTQHNGDGSSLRKALGLEHKIVIMYAGTFFDHKGIDVLIRAVQHIGNSDVKLVLIGDAPQKIRSLAGNETLFVGSVTMEEVAEYTALCDIYAIPTKDTAYARAEIPAKIFEPMMMGKPIVASRISDIPLILDRGRAGLLTEPGDAESLATALAELIEDKEKRAYLGQVGQKRFFEHYSHASTETVLERVYSML